MDYESIIFEKEEHVAIIRLNRPEKLNALNQTIRENMMNAINEVKEDDEIRALIITGNGRGFCAGVDIGGSQPNSSELPSQNQRLDELNWMGQQAIAVYRLDKPVIAAVNGIAVGAGMSLALSCDLRVGTEKTRFKTVFPERSLSPDSGMSFFLPRIIGYSRAADLIMTNRLIETDEAYRLGVLDRIFKHENLIDEAVALAKQIAFWPPMAIRSSKRVLQKNMEVDLETALRNETVGLQFARNAPHDVAESGLSWKERRAPKFTGK